MSLTTQKPSVASIHSGAGIQVCSLLVTAKGSSPAHHSVASASSQSFEDTTWLRVSINPVRESPECLVAPWHLAKQGPRTLWEPLLLLEGRVAGGAHSGATRRRSACGEKSPMSSHPLEPKDLNFLASPSFLTFTSLNSLKRSLFPSWGMYWFCRRPGVPFITSDMSAPTFFFLRLF